MNANLYIIIATILFLVSLCVIAKLLSDYGKTLLENDRFRKKNRQLYNKIWALEKQLKTANNETQK